ncbi:MAG: F0F1 ATP synthase subunit A [Candidatus Levybacteria bacterium]|nr:F0F1 ATP synthase subunit A [Candidatus Levybacteria bacterium]
MASFAPEVIFQIGRFPVTNTVINTILVDGFLLMLAFFVNRNISKIPGKFQLIAEYVIGGLYRLTESIAGDKTSRIFPFFITFFLFILIANWSGLIPGINTFGIIEQHGGKTHIIPFIRATTSDLNTTLALAVVSLLATHTMSLRVLGLSEYLSRFIPFFPFIISVLKGKPKFSLDMSGPINLVLSIFSPFVFVFVGLLELISEFVKVISLSFRLFGNIFAGEVVLETVSGIFAFIFPLPFLVLELVVGFVQALVFSMLTMAFMIILTTPHKEAEEVSHSSGV